MNKPTLFVLVAAVLAIVIVIGVAIFQSQPQKPQFANLDAFAKCLSKKSAIFYGAFWCPHCKNQKEMFADSFKYVTYIECSSPDGKSQLQICKDKKIENYPTWEFSDKSRLTGEVDLATLSKKTSCTLPNK